MKDAIKYIAIAGGAYLVYVYVISPMMQSGTSTTTTTTTTPPTGSSLTDSFSATQVTQFQTAFNQAIQAGKSGADAVAAGYTAAGVASGTPIPSADQVCPTGYTGTFPSCVPQTVQTCPSGTTGTYPQCTPVGSGNTTQPDNTFTSSDAFSTAWQARVASALATAAGVNSQNADTWSWYYQTSIGGSPISPSFFQGVLNYALTAYGGDRSALIPAATFVSGIAAANAQGLTGMGAIVPVFAHLGGLGSFWKM